MKLIERRGAIEIWLSSDGEYAVFGVMQSGDARWVPSLQMAREIAGI